MKQHSTKVGTIDEYYRIHFEVSEQFKNQDVLDPEFRTFGVFETAPMRIGNVIDINPNAHVRSDAHVAVMSSNRYRIIDIELFSIIVEKLSNTKKILILDVDKYIVIGQHHFYGNEGWIVKPK